MAKMPELDVSVSVEAGDSALAEQALLVQQQMSEASDGVPNLDVVDKLCEMVLEATSTQVSERPKPKRFTGDLPEWDPPKPSSDHKPTVIVDRETKEPISREHVE